MKHKPYAFNDTVLDICLINTLNTYLLISDYSVNLHTHTEQTPKSEPQLQWNGFFVVVFIVFLFNSKT